MRGFGPLAAVSVAVLVVTGVYLSNKVIGSVDAALFTIYGRTLLAKVMLGGVAGALAISTTWRLHRRVPSGTPRRAVMAEAVTATGILALAGCSPAPSLGWSRNWFRPPHRQPARSWTARSATCRKSCPSAPRRPAPVSCWSGSSTRADPLLHRSAGSRSRSSVLRGAGSPSEPSR